MQIGNLSSEAIKKYLLAAAQHTRIRLGTKTYTKDNVSELEKLELTPEMSLMFNEGVGANTLAIWFGCGPNPFINANWAMDVSLGAQGFANFTEQYFGYKMESKRREPEPLSPDWDQVVNGVALPEIRQYIQRVADFYLHRISVEPAPPPTAKTFDQITFDTVLTIAENGGYSLTVRRWITAVPDHPWAYLNYVLKGWKDLYAQFSKKYNCYENDVTICPNDKPVTTVNGAALGAARHYLHNAKAVFGAAVSCVDYPEFDDVVMIDGIGICLSLRQWLSAVPGHPWAYLNWALANRYPDLFARFAAENNNCKMFETDVRINPNEPNDPEIVNGVVLSTARRYLYYAKGAFLKCGDKPEFTDTITVYINEHRPIALSLRQWLTAVPGHPWAYLNWALYESSPPEFEKFASQLRRDGYDFHTNDRINPNEDEIVNGVTLTQLRHYVELLRKTIVGTTISRVRFPNQFVPTHLVNFDHILGGFHHSARPLRQWLSAMPGRPWAFLNWNVRYLVGPDLFVKFVADTPYADVASYDELFIDPLRAAKSAPVEKTEAEKADEKSPVPLPEPADVKPNEVKPNEVKPNEVEPTFSYDSSQLQDYTFIKSCIACAIRQGDLAVTEVQIKESNQSLWLHKLTKDGFLCSAKNIGPGYVKLIIAWGEPAPNTPAAEARTRSLAARDRLAAEKDSKLKMILNAKWFD